MKTVKTIKIIKTKNVIKRIKSKIREIDNVFNPALTSWKEEIY